MQIRKISRFGSYGVIIGSGKILLTRQKKGPYAGLWDLPGGGIEFNESPEDALKRELLEEVALSVEQFELDRIITNNGRYYLDEELIDFHHIGIIYQVRSAQPDEGATPEEEMYWHDLDSLEAGKLTPFAKKVHRLYFGSLNHKNFRPKR